MERVRNARPCKCTLVQHQNSFKLPARLPAPQAALLLFFPLYWGVGYSRGGDLGGFQSFTALLLFLGIVSSAGNLLHLLLQSSLATLCCGLWMAWNALFAGVLIHVSSRGSGRERMAWGTQVACWPPASLPKASRRLLQQQQRR